MATRTFTNGGVNNLWTTAGNWDTPPVDNDTVVIASGQTCTYDGDMSNAGTWPNGIAGITVTGTMNFALTGGPYYLKIKAATTIAGAGTLNVGTLANPIPFAVKHTITGGAAWYIDGSGGLTMTVYAAEPVIKTILLSGDEAVGQTELSVGTDVTGDIWAVGDTIRIDDINKAQESEERVIAAAGIASGAITVTAGLTAAKSTGAVVSLITRNVKLIGNGAAGYIIRSFASGKLTIAGGQWTTSNYRAIATSTNITVSGGTFAGSNRVIYICTGATVTGGVFSGSVSSVAYNTTNLSISGGSYTGNNIIADICYGATISAGTFSGNTYILNAIVGANISGGTFSGNTYPLFTCAGANISGGTFSSNTNALIASSAIIKNASFATNTYDLNQSVVTCFNTSFASTENISYQNLAKEVYSESYDHDQLAGTYKAWTKGGITSSATTPVPTGYTTCYIITLEDANNEGYWQREITVGAGASVNITMNLRKSASMTYLPRCIIFNKAATDPFAGGAGIHTFTMTDSVDTFEEETYTYGNSTANDVTLVIRFQGKNASGTVTTTLLVEQINVDLTTLINNLATVDTVVDAIKAKTDNLPSDPADQSAVEAAITAGIATIDTDSVLAATVEGAYSVQDVFKLMASVMAGKVTGGGTTTVTFRDLSDALDRVTATVDSNGNRSATTLDLS